jgi:hypothetical protein
VSLLYLLRPLRVHRAAATLEWMQGRQRPTMRAWPRPINEFRATLSQVCCLLQRTSSRERAEADAAGRELLDRLQALMACGAPRGRDRLLAHARRLEAANAHFHPRFAY